MNTSSYKAIEDFLLVKSDPPKRSSLAVVFGGKDLKLSDRVFELYNRGFCKYVLISGGMNRSLGMTEAEWHRRNLIKQGFPESKLLLEDKSRNSLELVLKKFKKLPARVIVVTKTFHGRRHLMTLIKHFSPKIDYVLQLVETKGHKVKNWWKDSDQRKHILDEIRKIVNYSIKGDIL